MKMKFLVFLILGLVVSPVFAGGDFVLGKLSRFSESKGKISFHFIQSDNGLELLPNCREFDMSVEYERVPSYSWIPFIKTTHPSYDQNAKAALFLQKAYVEKREVLFGYMGSGISETKVKCSFVSRGLMLEGDEKMQFVLSYYDPV